MLHPAPKPQNLELDHELVNLDYANRGHRPDGKFLSNHEMEVIAAHQDEIQGSLGDYQTAKQSAEWSTDADKFTQKYKDAVKQADELEQQANARKAEQSDEVKTTWATSAEHLSDVFQRVLKQTSDIEQQLESRRSNKTETESPTSVESTPDANEDNSIEARLQRVHEGHKQLDEIEKQLNGTGTNEAEATPAIEVKEDDFTEDHMRILREELHKDGKPSHRWERYPDRIADVVEIDDTQELPAQEAEETTPRYRISLKKVSNRITTVMQKAYTWGQIHAGEAAKKAADYMNDVEGDGARKETRQKFAAVTVILGASAIALGMKYGVDLDMGKGGGSANTLTPDNPHTGILGAQLDMVPTDHSEVHKMVAGDNLWNLNVEHAKSLGFDVGNNPADLAFIDAVTDKTAEINNFTDPDNLMVGTEVRMLTPEEIEELAKQYKS